MDLVKKFILSLSIASLIFFNTIYAEYINLATSKISRINTGDWYLSSGIGANWYTKPKIYYIKTPSSFFGTDSYSYDRVKNAAAFIFESGYEWKHLTKWLPEYSIGLRYSYYGNNKNNGIYKVSNGTFSYNFNYKIQSQNLLMLIKLGVLRWHDLSPYIVVGAGFARNRFSSYQEGNTVFSPYHTFSDNASNSFAYLVGLGINHQLNKHWQLNLEYYYFNLGEVKSGRNNLEAQTIPILISGQSVALMVSYHFV